MGLFGKKKDFWDEVDDSSVKESGYQTLSEEEEADIQRELDELEEDGWHPTPKYTVESRGPDFLIHSGGCDDYFGIYGIYIFQQWRQYVCRAGLLQQQLFWRRISEKCGSIASYGPGNRKPGSDI